MTIHQLHLFSHKVFRFLARSHYLFVNGGRGRTDLEAGLLSWALSQSAPLALPTLQSIPALPITLFFPQKKLQTVNANGKAFLEQTLSAIQCIFSFTWNKDDVISKAHILLMALWLVNPINDHTRGDEWPLAFLMWSHLLSLSLFFSSAIGLNRKNIKVSS